MPTQPATLTPATPPPAGDTYADLARACHRWLMQRDYAYRKNYEAYAANRDARNTRKARNTLPKR